MAANSNAFVTWEEHTINSEKGSRQILFFLKRGSGDRVLAVVGTERSARHFLYVVSDEFLQAFGCDGTIQAGTKWRTKRDTVEWLTSIISRDSTKAVGPGESSVSNKRSLRQHLPDHRIPRTPEVQLTCDVSERRGTKRSRSFGENQRLEAVNDGLSSSMAGSPEATHKPTCKKLKIKLPGGVSRNTEVGDAYKVGDKIEILSQDSGIRGCWFRCKVMEASAKRLKVQYVDLKTVGDESVNLEEWVPATRVAAPDKLGIRCQGRLTVRPWPPRVSLGRRVKIGAVVDAWWCEGWWEGVVLGGGSSGKDSIQVYVPGEDRVLTVRKEDARVSRDWKNGTWVELEATCEELCRIPSSISPFRGLHILTSLAFEDLDSYLSSSEDRESLTIKEKCDVMFQAIESNEASPEKDVNAGDGVACNEVGPGPGSENPEE